MYPWSFLCEKAKIKQRTSSKKELCKIGEKAICESRFTSFLIYPTSFEKRFAIFILHVYSFFLPVLEGQGKFRLAQKVNALWPWKPINSRFYSTLLKFILGLPRPWPLRWFSFRLSLDTNIRIKTIVNSHFRTMASEQGPKVKARANSLSAERDCREFSFTLDFFQHLATGFSSHYIYSQCIALNLSTYLSYSITTIIISRALLYLCCGI